MRLSHLLLALTATVMISACSKDPYALVVNDQPSAQLQQENDTISMLPPEEQELLRAYIEDMTHKNSAKSLTGKTISVVLAEAKTWRQLQEDAKLVAETTKIEEKAQESAENDALAQQLAESISVNVVAKKLLPANLVLNRVNETLLYTVEIENKMDKLILQVEGNLVATDKEGKEIGSLPVLIDKKLKEGSKNKLSTNPGWEINTPANTVATELAKYDLKDISLTFVPTSISYQGIETIGTPRVPATSPKTDASPASSAPTRGDTATVTTNQVHETNSGKSTITTTVEKAKPMESNRSAK